jgi:hypothetical protein
MAGRECCGSELARWDHDGSPQASPPPAEAGAGAGGPRPHAGLKARRLLRHRRVGDLPSP